MILQYRFTKLVFYFSCLLYLLLSNSCTSLIKVKAPQLFSYDQLHSLTEVIPENWHDEPVIILSDSTRLELLPGQQGNSLRYREKIVYYVNRQTPELIETLPVFDNTVLEDLPRTTLSVYYPDGTHWIERSSLSNRWRVHDSYKSSSNKFVEEMSIPRYSKGMIVIQTIERRYIRPEFLSKIVAGSWLPVCSRVIEVVVPDSASIAMKLFNRIQLPVTTSVTRQNGKQTHLYQFKSVEKVEHAELFTEAQQYIPTLYFSFPPQGVTSYSWNQLGEYYLSLIEESYTGQEELETQLTGINSENRDSIIHDALLFTRKKIRYHDYSEGLFAFIPHKIESILKNGYGDCKDMSIVCQSIGRMKKCPVGLLLLHMNDGFQPVTEIPTLGMFDHITISYISEEGEKRIVDPTVTHGKPLETGFYHVGKRALFLEKGNCRFDTVPTPDNFYNTILTKSEITHNKLDNKWELAGTIDLCGLTAMQLFMSAASIGKKERVPILKKYLKKYFELEINAVSLDLLSSDTIRISYSAPFQENYLRLSSGGFLINKPSLFGGDIKYTTLSLDGPRYYRDIRQYDLWRIPGRFSVLENSDFSHSIAEGKWRKKKGTIHREFKQNHICVTREEAREMLDARLKFSKATLWKK